MAASTVESGGQTQEPLRVSQLDASELDTELFDLLKTQLETTFKYFKPGLLVKYGPEMHACLRFILWKYTVQALDSTVGQQLLQLRYKDARQGAPLQAMTSSQKWLHALLTVGGPWLEQRRDDLEGAAEGYKYSQQLMRLVDWFQRAWKVAALLNFLVFLSRGRYQFLMERLLRIRAMFPRAQGVRQVGFEYMDRELLWHGFAEFLFFVLPLINFRKIKNFLMRLVIPSSSEKSAAGRTGEVYRECVVCSQWPNAPHEIGCRHIFCYYCVQSNYLADPSFSCPLCGHRVDSLQSIVPVQLKPASPD